MKNIVFIGLQNKPKEETMILYKKRYAHLIGKIGFNDRELAYELKKNKEIQKSWFKNAKLSKIYDTNKNRFRVAAGLSRKEWLDKGWIFKEDPLGWFEWYCRFVNGRRIPQIDEIQIKRWKAFGSRHVPAIKKNCAAGDVSCRKRQRQAILQWAYDPFI